MATDVMAPASAAPASVASSPAPVKHDCDCKGSAKLASLYVYGRNDSFASGRSYSSASSRNVTAKRAAQHNPSRALVLARRDALSKRGKSATTSSSTGAAAVARHGNADLTSRELSQKLRELKNKVGSAGTSRSGGTRPSGPNRHGSKQAAAADASWKVGVSETTRVNW